MRVALLVSACLVVIGSWASCGTDSEGGDEDTKTEMDIPAREITEFEVHSIEYCVGMDRQEKFAEYNYQCKGAQKKGDCITMEKPGDGKDFYCALCGLKGSEMVCFMINPQ